MGDVYRARDTRLARIVALKVLRKGLVDEPALRARFEREATVLASLNHPHIGSLYDVGRHDGAEYLVMEYLEGETLDAKLRTGRLAPHEILLWAIQIAEAVTEAHRVGVLHRDLKPGNIIITKGGVKLLDFGLARQVLPTGDLSLTAEGALLGTLPWMPPEQLEGKQTDARSDVFSLGAVLYQMVTGRPPFEAETQAGLIGAILTAEPEPFEPTQLNHVVKRCLAKDPEERWQTARDVMLELEWLGEEGAGLPAFSAPPPSSRLPWILLGLITALCIVLAYMSVQGRTADNKTWQLSVLPPDRSTITSFAFSPDGATLAFAATSEGKARLWLRRLDVLQPIPLDGTDDASYPFWSPDSRAIGFFAQGKLKKVSMSGGPPEILCDAPVGNGGSWNRQGTIIFTPGIFDGLFRIPASGGKPVQITIRDKTHSENSHRWPYFLPDGKHYLYMIRSEKSGLYVGQLGSPVSKRLIDNDSPAVYATGPDNRSQILFSRAFTLMAQRFDADSGQMLGEAYPLVPDVPADPLRGWGSFSVATAGRLVYQQLSSSGSVRHLVYLDRQGREHGLPLSNDASTHLAMSPDGKQVALQRPTGGATAETWILDTASTTARRFAVNGTFPIWSADGKCILLFAFRNGNFGLFHKSVNGADESELLLPSTAPKFPLDWSADQRFILFRQDDPETGSDIFVFSLNSTKSVAFLHSAHNERDAQFSPDGRWIAYTSDDLGSSEVWVQAFQGAQPASGPRWQVSQHGGGKPKWLFPTRLSMNDVSQQYTPLPDGKGFFSLTLSSGPSQPVTVVSDWKSSRP